MQNTLQLLSRTVPKLPVSGESDNMFDICTSECANQTNAVFSMKDGEVDDVKIKNSIAELRKKYWTIVYRQ